MSTNNDINVIDLNAAKDYRLRKGFQFEQEIHHTIRQCINYDYFQHNPTSYNEWLHNIGEGCDNTLVVKGLVFNIECKYLDTNRVYPSYIWRDYIPRFIGKSGYCVIVTNNKWNIPYTCRTILQERNIMIWNRHEITYNIITLTNAYLNNLRKNKKKIEFSNNTTKIYSNQITERVVNQKNKTEHPEKDKLSEDGIDQNGSIIKHKNCKESEVVFDWLFQNGLQSVHAIASKRRLISRVRRRLATFLYNCLLPDRLTFKVKTMKSWFGLRKYLDIYTKNIFNCMPKLSKLLKTQSIPISDVPDVLYHGTTTMFLPEIMREGLLPSKAGKCWNKNREKRVYLTDSLYAAEAYAINASDKFGGEPVILLIHIRNRKDKLKLSCEESNETHSSVFDIFIRFFTEDIIPREEIKDCYIFPKEKSLYLLIAMIKDYYSRKSTLDG